MILDWHKEPWIKKVSREDFVTWYQVNQKSLSLPLISDDEIGRIHDCHVLPKEELKFTPDAQTKTDNTGSAAADSATPKSEGAEHDPHTEATELDAE